MGIKRQVVLVTGAGSGFGRAIAEGLAADGQAVFGTLRRRKKTDLPGGVTPVLLDVTEEASVAAGVAQVLQAAGRIDMLVNNAGYGLAGAVEDTSAAEAAAQLDTNLLGMHRLCRAVLPGMRARRSGCIVNMSSLAGRIVVPFQGFYCASKFAVEAYTQALRMEVREFGIRVALVAPGDFATGFTANRYLAAGHTAASPYFERGRNAVARMAADEQANLDLTPVVAAVRQIIASEHPRLRYPRAAPLQRALAALQPLLPQRLVEYLVRKTYGLP